VSVSHMKIQRYDYASQFERFQEFMAELSAMIQNGHYVLSHEVAQFEGDFARYLRCSFVSAVNTGTDAVVCALKVLDICPGDEVITQANTFNATVAAICLAGARPVLVDVDENSFLMDTKEALTRVNSKTRVFLPVHLYGKATPMQELLEACERRELHLVEDAAQAHGARIEGQRVGTFGILGCFSFHPSKNLAAAGDGGAICTDRADLKKRLDAIRALGQVGQNNHIYLGYNTKLDSIQAKVLSWKLPMLDEWNEKRREVARMYRERLSHLPLRFQAWDDKEEHVFHLFAVRTDRRDQLLEHLQTNGVDAVVRYPTPIHLQPAFSDFGWKKGQFPVSEALACELLCLPMRPNLKESEIGYICASVASFFKGNVGIAKACNL
jgi:dTDP-4-amino-4,6-dideoxygalactose transaminase